jgi:hypothetical protein
LASWKVQLIQKTVKQTVPVAMLCSCHFIIKVNKNKFGPVYITKPYKAVEIQPHSFLTMVLDGVKWQASGPGRVTPRRNNGMHYKGNWMAPRAVVNVSGEVYICICCRDSNSDPFSP